MFNGLQNPLSSMANPDYLYLPPDGMNQDYAYDSYGGYPIIDDVDPYSGSNSDGRLLTTPEPVADPHLSFTRTQPALFVNEAPHYNGWIMPVDPVGSIAGEAKSVPEIDPSLFIDFDSHPPVQQVSSNERLCPIPDSQTMSVDNSSSEEDDDDEYIPSQDSLSVDYASQSSACSVSSTQTSSPRYAPSNLKFPPRESRIKHPHAPNVQRDLEGLLAPFPPRSFHHRIILSLANHRSLNGERHAEEPRLRDVVSALRISESELLAELGMTSTEVQRRDVSVYEIWARDETCVWCPDDERKPQEGRKRISRNVCHVRMHFAHRPFVCDSCWAHPTSCGKAFSSPDHLTDHRRDNRVKCPECAELYPRKNLRRHLAVCSKKRRSRGKLSGSGYTSRCSLNVNSTPTTSRNSQEPRTLRHEETSSSTVNLLTNEIQTLSFDSQSPSSLSLPSSSNKLNSVGAEFNAGLNGDASRLLRARLTDVKMNESLRLEVKERRKRQRGMSGTPPLNPKAVFSRVTRSSAKST